jgi:hypothetical protein
MSKAKHYSFPFNGEKFPSDRRKMQEERACGIRLFALLSRPDLSLLQRSHTIFSKSMI